jgi:hypothetical protein
MRWGDLLPKRSSVSDSVAWWTLGGKSPLAVKGGRGTNTPSWYQTPCVRLPQIERLLTSMAYVPNDSGIIRARALGGRRLERRVRPYLVVSVASGPFRTS